MKTMINEDDKTCTEAQAIPVSIIGIAKSWHLSALFHVHRGPGGAGEGGLAHRHQGTVSQDRQEVPELR